LQNITERIIICTALCFEFTTYLLLEGLMRRMFRFAVMVVVSGSIVAAWQDTGSADNVPPAVRAARDNLFALFVRGMPSMLSAPPGLPPPVTSVSGSPVPELPVELVQTILIGQVTGMTPRMMPGDRGIYTEYHVTAKSILMNHSAWKGPAFDAVRMGGVVVASDGRVLRHELKGVGKQMAVGESYVMFVDYRSAPDCFIVGKVWGIRDGLVVAMSSDDLARVSRGDSTVDGVPVGVVIARVLALKP
jgi:hypothetical protein